METTLGLLVESYKAKWQARVGGEDCYLLTSCLKWRGFLNRRFRGGLTNEQELQSGISN